MALDRNDVLTAAAGIEVDLGGVDIDLCPGLVGARELLARLRDQSGFRFWLRFGLSLAVEALDIVIGDRCDKEAD